MKTTRTSPFLWIIVAVVVVLLGAMTFMAGFGAGFGTGRVTAPQVASLNAARHSDRGQRRSRPTATPRALASPGSAPASAAAQTPEDFDLIWEAWQALDENFYGDLPATPETVGGLVEGLLFAVEQQTGVTLDREQWPPPC